MCSYTPQHSDPSWQNRHPKQAVPLTDADVATTSYGIQTQTGEKHPQVHHFPSEYRQAQLHTTAFRPKLAKPTPKTGSSPHGRKVGTLALAHKTGQHLETALLNEGGTDQLRA